jgi:hypothetical protein
MITLIRREIYVGVEKFQQKRAGTIRRVVRVEGRFVCGLCRNFYDHPIDAHDCLNSCWEETLAMDPVVVKRDHGRLLLRCLFCARDYDNRSAVLRCADECKRQKLRTAMAELKSTGPENLQSNRRPVRKLRPVIVPMTPVKKKGKSPKIALEKDQPPEVDSEELVTTADANERPIEAGDVAGVLAKEEPQNADPTKKKKPSEVFYRDQAKYVCTVCHEKYFTKLEVSNCYDSHE